MKNFYFKNFAKNNTILIVMSVMFTAISCKQNTRDQDQTQPAEIESREIEREVEPRAFIGEINSVGDSGNNLSGKIAMRVEGDLMRFTVSAEGLARDMMYMQYLLVSQNGDETQCPGTVEEVERMGDSNGITAASGTTIRRIPLHMGPTNLQMDSDTYPRSNINGELQFSRVVSLDSLRNAVRTEYNMQSLDFSKFTFIMRGLPEGQASRTQVTGSKSSAQNIPAGCAKLQETVIGD